MNEPVLAECVVPGMVWEEMILKLIYSADDLSPNASRYISFLWGVWMCELLDVWNLHIHEGKEAKHKFYRLSMAC